MSLTPLLTKTRRQSSGPISFNVFIKLIFLFFRLEAAHPELLDDALSNLSVRDEDDVAAAPTLAKFAA